MCVNMYRLTFKYGIDMSAQVAVAYQQDSMRQDWHGQLAIACAMLLVGATSVAAQTASKAAQPSSAALSLCSTCVEESFDAPSCSRAARAYCATDAADAGFCRNIAADQLLAGGNATAVVARFLTSTCFAGKQQQEGSLCDCFSVSGNCMLWSSAGHPQSAISCFHCIRPVGPATEVLQWLGMQECIPSVTGCPGRQPAVTSPVAHNTCLQHWCMRYSAPCCQQCRMRPSSILCSPMAGTLAPLLRPRPLLC
jgi:hypothetical protein